MPWAAPREGYASIRAALRVAVVIPTLNEKEALARHLPGVLAISDRVVVSDGGSTDGTRELAADLGAVTVEGPPGRGPQLNRGAARAEADALLFLHADTSLPEDAMDQIRTALGNGAGGGGFLLEFDSARPIFRLLERVINLRTRISRVPLGDQAQFVRADLFHAVRGFPDWPILEDLVFIRRLRSASRITVLSSKVRTSARRYEAGGVVRTVGRNWLIWSLFLLGVPPTRLARLYRQRIATTT